MEPTEHFGIYFGYIRRLFQSWVSPFKTEGLSRLIAIFFTSCFPDSIPVWRLTDNIPIDQHESLQTMISTPHEGILVVGRARTASAYYRNRGYSSYNFTPRVCGPRGTMTQLYARTTVSADRGARPAGTHWAGLELKPTRPAGSARSPLVAGLRISSASAS